MFELEVVFVEFDAGVHVCAMVRPEAAAKPKAQIKEIVRSRRLAPLPRFWPLASSLAATKVRLFSHHIFLKTLFTIETCLQVGDSFLRNASRSRFPYRHSNRIRTSDCSAGHWSRVPPAVSELCSAHDR
nr:hypothetical protein [Dyella silvae]